MRRWLVRGAVVGGVVLVIAAAGVFSGVLPLAARGGHWAVTEEALRFVKDRWVTARGWGAEAPIDLDAERWVVLGAGHYESGCRPCHGVPGMPQPVVGQAMLPPPTDLTVFAADEPADELFVVIHNGIKFTGMPGWPAAGRADEVWPVVAFVRRLPGMTADDYWVLVGARDAPTGAPAVVGAVCARCHGVDGMGRGGGSPVLAGQRADYMVGALRAYRDGARPSGYMQPTAAAMSEVEIEAAAGWYAGLDGLGGGAREGDGALARVGAPADKVPACEGCHGDGGDRSAHYPRLGGQHGDYLRAQLALFRAGRRGGSPYAELMEAVRAHTLSDAQVEAVVGWYGR